MTHLAKCAYPRAYHMGRERRESGGGNAAPAILKSTDRHWWLAGWNDRDIEMREAGK